MSYASGKHAFGLCDICGQRFKLNTLKAIVNSGVKTGHRACNACWSPDHPQNNIGRVRVNDAIALRDPRPEKNLVEMRNIRWAWRPVYALEAQGQIGEITVTVTA